MPGVKGIYPFGSDNIQQIRLRKEEEMKRYLRKIAVLTAAAVMTMTPVMTTCAETVKEDTVYTLPTIKTSWETGTSVTQDINMEVLFSEEQLLTAPEVVGWAEKQLPVVEGAEWKKVYMYRNKDASKNTDFSWQLDVENSTNWKAVSSFGIEEGKLTHLYNFSIIINGVDFSNCKLYGGAMGDYDTENGFSGEHCMFVLVPLGYDGDISFSVCGNRLEGNSHVKNEAVKLTYFLSGHSKEAAEAEAAAKEAEEKAKSELSWKQDVKGWWLERPDGSYLISEWYQSPESGLWYYMGEDGYMLTNTVTPDGCKVNADGVWVE